MEQIKKDKNIGGVLEKHSSKFGCYDNLFPLKYYTNESQLC